MTKYSVEIKWNVSVINDIETPDMKYYVCGDSVDGVFEQEMEKLGERYNSLLQYESYAEHNAFKRFERFFYEGRFVGIMTVAVVTA